MSRASRCDRPGSDFVPTVQPTIVTVTLHARRMDAPSGRISCTGDRRTGPRSFAQFCAQGKRLTDACDGAYERDSIRTLGLDIQGYCAAARSR